MGGINESIRIGLLDGNQLLGLGIFARRDSYFECSRLAFHGHVAGGMSRIIQALWRSRGKAPVVTFVDSRYASGDGHAAIGFEHLSQSPETYLWVLPDKVRHQRFLSNDNKCSRSLLYFRPYMKLSESIAANGIYRMWLPPKHKMILKPA